MADRCPELERIKEIIEDQRALEKHQRAHGAEFDSIEFGRVDAYRHIVQLLTGLDIRYSPEWRMNP